MKPLQLSQLLRQLRGDGLVGHITVKGAASAVVNICSTLLGFTLVVILTRNLDPAGYGTYVYVIAFISIVAIPIQLGLPRLVVRETAKAEVNAEWGLMRGLWSWTNLIAGSASIFLAVTILLFSNAFDGYLTSEQYETLFFGLLLIPFIVLGALRSAALQGLRHVILGQIPENILRPIFLIILLLGMMWWGTENATPAYAMALHVIAAGVAFTIGAWLLYRNQPPQLKASPERIYRKRIWLTAAWPLALTTGMQQFHNQLDVIILGVFNPADDVGVYRVAVQTAMLVAFGLQVVAMFASPYIARLHAQGEAKQLQRFVMIVARMTFIVALPLALIFIVFGSDLLRLLFGDSYVGAYLPLVIIVLGQLFHAFFGPIGIVLNMIGCERDTLKGVAIAASLNVALNFTLIPLYGMNGAAVATAISRVVWIVVLWSSLCKRLDIRYLSIFRL